MLICRHICLLRLFSVIAVCGIVMGGCTNNSWRSGEIGATVIDAVTGEPVPGAIVAANWQIKGMEGVVFGQLAIFEVVTDAAGKFVIPAWGPRSAPSGVVRGSEPLIRVFAPGYVPRVMQIGVGGVRPAPHNMKTSIDGQTIQLLRFEGTDEQYAAALDRFYLSMTSIIPGTHCEWRDMPRTFLEMDKLRRRFDSVGVGTSFPTLQLLSNQNRCGNAEALFERFKQ